MEAETSSIVGFNVNWWSQRTTVIGIRGRVEWLHQDRERIDGQFYYFYVLRLYCTVNVKRGQEIKEKRQTGNAIQQKVKDRL